MSSEKYFLLKRDKETVPKHHLREKIDDLRTSLKGEREREKGD